MGTRKGGWALLLRGVLGHRAGPELRPFPGKQGLPKPSRLLLGTLLGLALAMVRRRLLEEAGQLYLM